MRRSLDAPLTWWAAYSVLVLPLVEHALVLPHSYQSFLIVMQWTFIKAGPPPFPITPVRGSARQHPSGATWRTPPLLVLAGCCRVKVVVGEQGTYYLFERVPECDPRFVQIAEAGKRQMQAPARLLVVATCAGLAASGVALGGYNHFALLVAATLLGTLAFAVAEQVALNAMQFGNEVAALSAESVDSK